MKSPSSTHRTRLLPIALAQGVGLGCGVVGVKITSKLVPPAALGEYGVFLTFATVGAAVVCAGLVKFVGRHWASAPDRAGLRREVLRAWRRRLPWLATAGVVVAAANWHIANVPAVLVATALFAAMVLLSLAALGQAALQAAREHWRDSVVATGAAVTRTFAPLLLFVALGGASGLYLGFCVHAVVVAVAAAIMLRGTWCPAVPADAAPQLTAAYEGPLFTLLAFSGWALAGLNRWVVAWFLGETEAGYFTLAGGAALLVPSVLGTVALQYFQPGFFSLGDQNSRESRARLAQQVDRVAAGCSGLALAGLVVLGWIAPWLVGPLIDENYRSALRWLLPAGCFGVAVTGGLFFHSLLLAGRRERACGPVDLSAAALLIAGSVGAAALGEVWLQRWLCAAPLVPWLVNRPLARHFYFLPPAAPAPAPGR